MEHDKHLFVPFAPPDITQSEIVQVIEVLRSGWLSSGPKTAEFEHEFCRFIGCKNSVAVSSATAGLALALEVFGIGAGDKVATSVLTFSATVEAITARGAIPILVDIDPTTRNLDPASLGKTIYKYPDIKAVIPVHYGGRACDMQAIESICRPRKIVIIEDAAHAFPSKDGDRHVGTIGDATVFSFYANKPLSTGEGGMVTVADPLVANQLRKMRLHGISKPIEPDENGHMFSWQYDITTSGSKCNMPETAAAMGLVQLERSRDMHVKRIQIAQHYLSNLPGLPLVLPGSSRNLVDDSWHLFVVQLDLEAVGMTRNDLAKSLERHGVQTSVHYKPLHLHTYWAAKLGYSKGAFPNAEHAFTRMLSLPIYSAMGQREREHVVASLKAILG